MTGKKKALMLAGGLALVTVLFGCGSIPPAPLMEKSAQTATVFFMLGNTVTVTATGGLTLGTQHTLWDSDTFLSMLGQREYVALNFPAGTHYFMASCENWYIVKAELAAGRTYYFDVTTVPGVRQANVVLKIIEPGSGDIEKFLKDYKEVSPKGKTAEAVVKEARKKLDDALGGSENVDVVPASMGR
jgi:ABC-type glycerol-3-phosphate transport system substrate-binding protein